MAIAVYPDGLVPSTATLTLLAANDAVVLPVSGNDWATVLWTVTAAGSGAITTEYATDSSASPVNWLPSPRSVLVSTVSANPSTAPWANNGPVAGTYETPLPFCCTAFRIRYQTGGTATTITMKGGMRYFPGVGVIATIFDTTSAVNTAIDTGLLDVSGWAGFSVTFVTPAGGSGAVKGVDDAGANTSVVTVPASATVTGVFSAMGATGTALAAAGVGSFAFRAKRAQVTSAQVAALTSRIRIEAWR